MIKRTIIFILIININTFSEASIKDEIILNFKKINNLSFNFKQTINEKTEEGNCIIEYPKKIFCSYDDIYNKILVSNGKSLIINSDKIKNYYRYPLKKTPLNLILDKKFIISKIYQLKNDPDYPFYYVFDVDYENFSIKVFFDKNSLDLKGWQTKDAYSNDVSFIINNLKINNQIVDDFFKIPKEEDL